MDMSDEEVCDWIHVLMETQQRVFGGQLNAVVQALRGQRASVRRAALICFASVVCCATNGRSLWLPGEPERVRIFLRTIRDNVQFFVCDELDLTTFLERARLFWQLA